MAKQKFPVTPAIRALRDAKVPFVEHLYSYVDRGGTSHSARELCVDEHHVVKTLVFEKEDKSPLLVLMHGDWQVSEKNLARLLQCKTISPCSPPTAQKHTGYQVGGTSPFGTRRRLPVYAEESIAGLDRMYINGGKRGFLVEVSPTPALSLLKAQLVTIKSNG